VTVRGRAISLSTKEYELLLRLAGDPQRVFTKGELLRDVWGYRADVRTRTVDAHACRLRRKLRAADGVTDFVDNAWGVGYRLLGPLDDPHTGSVAPSSSSSARLTSSPPA
jgi:DNA-binding response OmpR family regulator